MAFSDKDVQKNYTIQTETILAITAVAQVVT